MSKQEIGGLVKNISLCGVKIKILACDTLYIPNEYGITFRS